MDQALIAGQNTVSHGPFVIHPSILVIPFPCSAQGKAWPSASSLPSRSSSTPCDCRRGGSPRFPGQRRSQVVHALPSELATCLHSFLRPLVYPKAQEQSKRATLLDPKIRPPNRHGFRIQRAQGSFIFLDSFSATPTSAPTPADPGIADFPSARAAMAPP